MGHQDIKKVDERSTEKIISDIRANRKAKLHVSVTDYDVLVADYDKALAEIERSNKVIKEWSERGIAKDAETAKIAALEAEIRGLRNDS
jgi:hypothetical protein